MQFVACCLLILHIYAGKIAAQTRIVAGTAVQDPQIEFRSYGLIVIAASEYRSALSVHCGSTQIHERFVVTALHCFPNDKWKNGYYSIWFDCVNRCNPQQRGTQYGIQQIYKVPGAEYSVNSTTNLITLIHDICLIELDRARRLPKYPRLSTTAPVGVGAAVGYGLMSNYNKKAVACRMQKTHEEYITSTSECRKLQKKMIEKVEGNFCTRSHKATATCNGDSGGPFFQFDYDEGDHVLVGVTSFGPAHCDAQSAFDSYTAVNLYIDWIKNVTGE